MCIKLFTPKINIPDKKTLDENQESYNNSKLLRYSLKFFRAI